MMRGLTIAKIVFAVLYAVALVLFAIGTRGLLGAEPDPLSGVFLISIGLPWNRFVEVFPEASWPWLMALAPALNLLVLIMLRRLAARKPKEVWDRR